MKRKGAGKKISWEFIKGVYGRYKNQKSIPIDFLSTTFDSQKWNLLSYANEINTDYNFELLIQRDIDKDRAIAGISKYLDPDNSNEEDLKREVKFLPPIIAAIVNVGEDGNISSYYPSKDFEEKKDSDDYTCVFNTWGDCFGSKFYVEGEGASLFERENGQKIIVDNNNVELKLNLGIEESPGARLVVIDGQHRLYALKHLAKQNPDSVKDIHLPVCILFSPLSHEGNKEDPSIPKVHQVLRSLFIDINHTVERVSGHFFTLLSDQTLAGSICRKFCSEVLNNENYGKQGLGLIEWNIKSDKESKVVSKPYSITSIGVISEAFNNYFKNKSNSGTLTDMLGLDSHDLEDLYEMGSGTDRQSKSTFPWKEFNFEQKAILEDKCESTIAKQLVRLFFNELPYKRLYEHYSHVLQTEIISKADAKTGNSDNYISVRKRIFSFQPILRDESDYQNIYKDFIKKVAASYKDASPHGYVIITKTVFQKGVLLAWFELCKRLLRKLSLEDTTTMLICLVDQATSSDKEVFSNTDEHLFLQNTIFNGIKIDPSVESSKQISRLILAQLGSENIINLIIPKLKAAGNKMLLNNEFTKIGVSSSGTFVDVLFKKRIAFIKKHYSADYSIHSTVRDEIRDAEENYLKGVEGVSDEDLEAIFNKLLWNNIKDDYYLSKSQLDECIGFSTRKVSYEEEYEDD
jgi:hypothetical protein